MTKRLFCALVCLLISGTLAIAQETVSDGDFTFNEGFWWRSGVPYTRERVTSGGGGYYYCGRYYAYPQTYYYNYSRAAIVYREKKVEVKVPQVPVYTPNWK